MPLSWPCRLALWLTRSASFVTCARNKKDKKHVNTASKTTVVFGILAIGSFAGGCAKAPDQAKGCSVAAVNQCFEHTVVYVRIDPSKAGLPWTITRDRVRLLTKDNQRVTAVGIALAGNIAFALPRVNILRREDGKGLRYELFFAHANAPIELVTPLERVVEPGEIAFSFPCRKDDATSLEIDLSEEDVVVLRVQTK